MKHFKDISFWCIVLGVVVVMVVHHILSHKSDIIEGQVDGPDTETEEEDGDLSLTNELDPHNKDITVSIEVGMDPGPTPVNCQGNWSAWGECNKECGGGQRSRTYTVNQVAANGGSGCPFLNNDVENGDCNIQPCQPDTTEIGATETGETPSTCGEGRGLVQRDSGGIGCDSITDNGVMAEQQCNRSFEKSETGEFNKCIWDESNNTCSADTEECTPEMVGDTGIPYCSSEVWQPGYHLGMDADNISLPLAERGPPDCYCRDGYIGQNYEGSGGRVSRCLLESSITEDTNRFPAWMNDGKPEVQPVVDAADAATDAATDVATDTATDAIDAADTDAAAADTDAAAADTATDTAADTAAEVEDVGYVIRNSGYPGKGTQGDPVGGGLLTRDECELASSELGGWVGGGRIANTPAGCYMNTNGLKYYNEPDDANKSIQCSNNYKCITKPKHVIQDSGRVEDTSRILTEEECNDYANRRGDRRFTNIYRDVSSSGNAHDPGPRGCLLNENGLVYYNSNNPPTGHPQGVCGGRMESSSMRCVIKPQNEGNEGG